MQLFIDGLPLGAPLAFRAPNSTEKDGVLILPVFAEQLEQAIATKELSHTVYLQMTDGSDTPFSVQVAYSSLSAPNSLSSLKLSLKTALIKNVLDEGEGTQLKVDLVNGENRGLPMTVCVVGIPAGIELRQDQLQEVPYF